MTARARFDLTMDAEEKDVVSRAAALISATMAGFVRAAAKEKALALLDRASRCQSTTSPRSPRRSMARLRLIVRSRAR